MDAVIDRLLSVAMQFPIAVAVEQAELEPVGPEEMPRCLCLS
jgi:hypothetical protein